jgi:excisionase family DNA binding protein
VEHYCRRALEAAIARRAEHRLYRAELIEQVGELVAGPQPKAEASAEPNALAYTPSQAAGMLNVSTDSVRQACKDGQLQHWRWGDRILIPREELENVARVGLGAAGVATPDQKGQPPERPGTPYRVIRR